MTHVEIEQALALGRCKFSPGSVAKRFAHWAENKALHEPDFAMTAKGSAFLGHLAHSYRRQIGKCLALRCETCVAPELPAPSDTVERFASAKINRGWCKRFMALQGDLDNDTGEIIYTPFGGLSPSTFKTLRNARKSAGEDGFVVVFEPGMLPVVADEATHDGVDLGNELDEESFAERQLLYWERELAAVRARKA